MSIEQMKKKIHGIGRYVGVRYLRNQGVPFETAYFVIFNRHPKV